MSSLFEGKQNFNQDISSSCIKNIASKPRDLDIALSFLNENTYYSVQIFKDGINADRNAMDYKVDQKTMSSTTPIKIQMSRGGRFSAIFTKNNSKFITLANYG
jgi:hypothetical protein